MDGWMECSSDVMSVMAGACVSVDVQGRRREKDEGCIKRSRLSAWCDTVVFGDWDQLLCT